jgi:hypothetical protein
MHKFERQVDHGATVGCYSLRAYVCYLNMSFLLISQAAYLLAWLMFLRVDEVVNLEFESIEIIPGERESIGC